MLMSNKLSPADRVGTQGAIFRAVLYMLKIVSVPNVLQWHQAVRCILGK